MFGYGVTRGKMKINTTMIKMMKNGKEREKQKEHSQKRYMVRGSLCLTSFIEVESYFSFVVIGDRAAARDVVKKGFGAKLRDPWTQLGGAQSQLEGLGLGAS